MAQVKVSKKQATNQKTGRLKKGYKAVGNGVYVKVSATRAKSKRKTTKAKITSKSLRFTSKIKAKVKRLIK